MFVPLLFRTVSVTVRLSRPAFPRAAIFLAVLLAHGLLVIGLRLATTARASAELPVTAAFFLVTPPVQFAAPPLVPTVADTEPEVNLTLPLLPVEVEASGASEAVHSAPVLATAVPSDIRGRLAQQAGLLAGQSVTVVVRVQVLPTGQAGVVAIEQSGGSALIDAAALEYVRLLSWIAGRRAGEATAMTIRMAVNLVA